MLRLFSSLLTPVTTTLRPILLPTGCASGNSAVFRRFRSGGNPKRRPPTTSYSRRPARPGFVSGPTLWGEAPVVLKKEWGNSKQSQIQSSLASFLDADTSVVRRFLEEQAPVWAQNPNLHPRLISFGIPSEHIEPLLSRFAAAASSGGLSTDEAYANYSIGRLARASPADLESNVKAAELFDEVMSAIFFGWTSDPANLTDLASITSAETVVHIQRLVDAASRRFPAEQYPRARARKRKIIMHVGPTNSGKTYHALRALAAAPTGAYCGPLRLLAHEIWERLNLGMIRPLGIDDDEVEQKKLPPIIGETPNAESTPVPRVGNPKWVRPCNMITGEEVRIVDTGANLVSCTVEMLSPMIPYDVVVIDEIQMIGEPERGPAWTNAVLGANAEEVHLCGEDTAVPIVREILKDTGDEIVVNRYERLTPLEIEDESLHGNMKLIKKGDCVVTFSRKNIFGLKNKIEKATGLTCAVVYGRLPAETRSVQADLFNDPKSRFDVMIGSDAIGMGLNLKIRRVIFETVQKFDSYAMAYLSISQTKQIAGRAGRFGMHGHNMPGSVTTISQRDLAFVKHAMQVPNPTLPTARVALDLNTSDALADVLPPEASIETLHDAHLYISQLPPAYRYSRHGQISTASDFLSAVSMGEEVGGQLDLGERILFLFAPMPWRDRRTHEFCALLIKSYRIEHVADLLAIVKACGFETTLMRVEDAMIKKGHPSRGSLETLETFHACLGLYLWLHYRRPVSFPDVEEASELRTRLEKGLIYCLQHAGKRPKPGVKASMEQRTIKEKIGFSTKKPHRSQGMTPVDTVRLRAAQSF